MDQGIIAILPLAQNAGIGVIMMWLWWVERKRTIKLEERVEVLHRRLDECLESRRVY
jgi:hypothetical protein